MLVDKLLQIGNLLLHLLIMSFSAVLAICFLIYGYLQTDDALLKYFLFFYANSYAQQEASFSQLKIWQSGAIAVVFFVSPHITFTTMVTVLAVTLVVSLVGLGIITFYIGKAIPQISWSRYNGKASLVLVKVIT